MFWPRSAILAAICVVAALMFSGCAKAQVAGSNQPAHWTSRVGIISMQYAAGPSYWAGSVLYLGDSLQEQRPVMPPGYPLILPPTTSGPMQGYPAQNYSMQLNGGLMGIGAHDLATFGVQIINSTAPGRIVFNIGMNDAMPGNNNSQFLAQWVADVNTVISAAVAKVGGANVLIETTPQPTDGAHDLNLLATMNNILLKMPSQYAYVQVYDICAREFKVVGSPRPGFLAGDGVHLGAYGVMQRAFDEQSLLTGQTLGAQP